MLAKSKKYFFEGLKKAFDYKSTTTRIAYWYFWLGFIVYYFPIKIIQALSESMLYFSDASDLIQVALGIISHTTTLLIFLLIITSLFCQISLANRRIRDLGMNTWLTPLFIVPILNIILSLIFFTRKGSS